MHIKTFSLDIMYHEGQIQYIFPTKLASKHVTTSKLMFNNNPSFISSIFFSYTFLYIIFISKTIKYMQKKERTFSYVLMSKQVYDLIISYNTSFTLILDTNQ